MVNQSKTIWMDLNGSTPCVYKTNGHFWKWKFWMASNCLSEGWLMKGACTRHMYVNITLTKSLYAWNDLFMHNQTHYFCQLQKVDTCYMHTGQRIMRWKCVCSTLCVNCTTRYLNKFCIQKCQGSQVSKRVLRETIFKVRNSQSYIRCIFQNDVAWVISF